MRIEFKPGESSTVKGFIWLIFGVVGVYVAYSTKSLTELIVFAPMVANGITGIITTDEKEK